MADGEILAELILDGDKEFQSGMQQASDSTREMGEASQDASQGGEQMEESLIQVDEAAAAAGAGLIAVGGAMQQVVQQSKNTRKNLAQTAVTMGTSSDEAIDLATSISDAGFSMKEVQGTMSTLSERGVTSQEEMAALSEEFNTLSKAVGTTTPEATQTAIQAMRAFGDDASDIGENMDTLTFVARSTSLQFDEIGDVVSDIQPQIDKLGLSMSDVAVYLAALEEEGVGAQRAQEMFAQAAEKADGSQEALVENLGLSNDAISQQREELEQAEGSTEQYADAADSTITTTDKLQSAWQDAKVQLGNFLGPVEAAGPVLMGLGGALTALSTINFSAVVPSLGAVYTSLLPLLPVLLPLIAVVGALGAAWATDFMGMRGATQKFASSVIKWLKILGKRFLAWVNQIRTYMAPFIKLLKKELVATIQVWAGHIKTVLGFISNLWESHGAQVMAVIRPMVKIVTTLVKGMLDGIVTTIRVALALLRGDWEGAWNIMAGFLERQAGRIKKIAGLYVDAVKAQIMLLKDIAADAAEGFIDALTQGIKDAANAPAEAAEDVVDNVSDYLPGSDAKKGPLSTLTASGKALPETMAKGMEESKDAPAKAAEEIAGESSEAMENIASSPGGPASASRSGQSQGQTVEVDAKMESGAIQFNGITWKEAMSKVKGIIDDRFTQIERNIRRKYLRGGGA